MKGSLLLPGIGSKRVETYGADLVQHHAMHNPVPASF